MTPRVLVRHMQPEDISQVVAIDRLSFTTPWPANAYRFEITHRDTSHLVVLGLMSNSDELTGIRRLMTKIRGGTTTGTLAGYGGCWLIAGEAHISTIAVHPNYRGQGFGELLLASMLKRAIMLDGEYSVLEVRESNYPAQALYQKYEYRVVGRRQRYYRDNREDALLMEARPLDQGYLQRLNQRLATLSRRVQFEDHFTE